MSFRSVVGKCRDFDIRLFREIRISTERVPRVPVLRCGIRIGISHFNSESLLAGNETEQ